MQCKPDSRWTYLTSKFDIATRYMLHVRRERTGCIVQTFPYKLLSMYTKTAIMRRSITELCTLTSFFIMWWKCSIEHHDSMAAEQKLQSLSFVLNRHGNCATAKVDTVVLGKFQAACISKITVELTTFLPCSLMSETEYIRFRS